MCAFVCKNITEVLSTKKTFSLRKNWMFTYIIRIYTFKCPESPHDSMWGTCWGQTTGSSVQHMQQHIEYVLYYIRAEKVETAECQEHDTTLLKQMEAFRLGKIHAWLALGIKKRKTKEAVELRVDITAVHLMTIMWIVTYELCVVYKNTSGCITRRNKVT